MSRLSLKNDFKDGEVLYGNQINTNNNATVAAVNDNYEKIQSLDNLKADVSNVNSQLATKVDVSTFNDSINSLTTTKADVSLVNTKADKSELAAKADVSMVEQGLANKADTNYVNTQLSAKADTSYVNTQLGTKADKATTYTKEETDAAINSSVSNKADITYVNSQVSTKANASDLGDLSDLETTNKSSAVAAINEVLNEGTSVSNIDYLTITKNASDAIQTVGVIDKNGAGYAVKTWTGTKEEYNALETKDANTLYYITDDYEEPEVKSNKVTDINSTNTDEQYPSAKAVYDAIQDIPGGGGETYTAGTNIEITEENVINNTIPYSTDSDYGLAIALGVSADINNDTSNIAIGRSSEATGVGSTSIGSESKATSTRTIAVGEGAKALGNSSMSLGAYATSNYANSISIGRGAESTKNNQVMFGDVTYPIDEMAMTTSGGTKTVATTDITDSLDTRVEALEQSGGSGGTTDYEALTNKPQINGVTLEDNKSLADLGIKQTYTANDIAFTDGETFQQKYDAGELTGPKGDTGNTGPQGVQGETGPAGQDGADATINGQNTLNILAGTNISLDQQGTDLTINATGGSGGGATYTAGTNIEITEDNVINNTIPYISFGDAGANQSTAIGYNATVNDINSLAIGSNSSTVTSGFNGNSTALGAQSKATNMGCVAVGTQANATGLRAVAIGESCYATSKYSVIIGSYTGSDFASSIAIGYGSKTTQSNQFIIGGKSAPINVMNVVTEEGTKEIATTDLIEALEARIATLEAKVAALEGGSE